MTVNCLPILDNFPLEGRPDGLLTLIERFLRTQSHFIIRILEQLFENPLWCPPPLGERCPNRWIGMDSQLFGQAINLGDVKDVYIASDLDRHVNTCSSHGQQTLGCRPITK